MDARAREYETGSEKYDCKICGYKEKSETRETFSIRRLIAYVSAVIPQIVSFQGTRRWSSCCSARCNAVAATVPLARKNGTVIVETPKGEAHAAL